MISLQFPDGSRREFEPGVTGREVAESIAKSLAKKAVAMSLDGQVKDLAEPIKADAKIRILTREDQEALALIRHDAAHVMAEAVQELYPGTQVTIGPVIENGFYYDFARDEPFTPEDLPVIEAKMREIIARDSPFTCEVIDRNTAKRLFADKGETFKLELIDAIPEGDEIKIYSQREWLDLCRGPHMTSTGKVGKGFKLLKIAGAYWRGDSTRPMLQRIYGTAWASEEELAAEPAMVAPLGFLELLQIGVELVLLGEGGAVDAGQHRIVAVAAPIGARHLHQLEGVADLAGRGHVRAAAQVEPVALLVDLDRLVFRNGVDQLDLEILAHVAEHALGLVARPHLFGERFVARDDLAHLLLDRRKVFRGERLVASEIVIKAVLDHRADRHLSAGPK